MLKKLLTNVHYWIIFSASKLRPGFAKSVNTLSDEKKIPGTVSKRYFLPFIHGNKASSSLISDHERGSPQTHS
jgi:hypothetical protein